MTGRSITLMHKEAGEFLERLSVGLDSVPAAAFISGPCVSPEMTPVITAFTLLNFFFAASNSAISEGQLQVLSEVVSGPAHGRPLALHLDPTLSADVRRAVVGGEAVRRTPHFILTFGLCHSLQEVALPGDSSSSAVVLHVVLWLAPRPELLQTLWLQWKPRNLLLFSLGPSPGTDLLRHEALSGVENVALIGLLSAQADPRPDKLGVYTVLPFSPGGVRLLGSWRRETFASWEALFPDRFPSFEGYTFHLATFIDDAPNLYNDTSRTSVVGRGVAVSMMECFSAQLNFTYTLTIKPPDSKWGAIENGSWSGLLGMIARKEKLFTINGLAFAEDRNADFDRSELITMESWRLFLAMPQPLSKWLSLVRPFTPTVWAILLVLLLFLVCFMRIMAETSDNYIVNNNYGVFGGGSSGRVGVATLRPQVKSSHSSAIVSWLELYGAMVCQSAPVLPRALWQRVFLAVWLPCCLVVAAAYTCNLVGIFTTPAYPQRLASLQQLADSRIRMAVVDDGSFSVTFLQESTDPHLHRLQQRRDVFPTWRDAALALSKGTHAILMPETYMELLLLETLKQEDGWYTLEDALNTLQAGWYFRKHTPWKSKFDHGIRQLSWFGLIRHWHKVETEEWIRINLGRRHRGGSGRDAAAPPLTLEHLQGVFYILVLAWVAGGAALLLELLTHRHQERLATMWRC
ncbi:glutamate receptor ionotropic, kainate 4-like isoform X2 [Eriocheir sinensis]|uniref:glutamate receptor ionotropic, kainate 4-like isoform X1 n=1 Tax=Eriocheir sinensis TaxID=95602 RepID=UPI0021C91AAA|nr:glutamate receptor ionotropic, kainate 4-like isoform X1 [Eriocheir sinensis]XP_050734073.1 glutamate receptor ionotropic, kainate 4-like isoform X2 [Eriocheir sinensis]